MEQIFSIGQAARMLGIQAYRIAYAIETGQLPEAKIHFLHKRCFSEQDIAAMADFFGIGSREAVPHHEEAE